MLETIRYSYKRLWKLLVEKGLKKKDLQALTHISATVIAKMGRGEPVHMETLGRICAALSCTLPDIVEITYGRD